MRNQSVKSRASVVSRTAMIVFLAGSAAACSSDTSRFMEGPLFSGGTGNQRTILSQQSAPAADTTGSLGGAPAPVTSSILPPVPGQQAALPPAEPARAAQGGYPQGGYQSGGYPAGGYQQAAAPQPVRQPTTGWQAGPAPYGAAGPRVAAAAPAAAPAVPRASGAYSAAGGTTIVLQPGDTLDVISRRYGVPTGELMAANNVADARSIQAGQRFLIPVYAGGAPKPVLVAAPAPVKAVAVGGAPVGPHVVRPGESLDRIAATYGVSKARLMQANGLKGDVIRPGQKLILPSGSVLRVAAIDKPVEKVSAFAPASAPVAAPAVAAVVAPPIVAGPVAAPPAAAKTAKGVVASVPPAAAPAEAVMIAKDPEVETQRGEAKSGQPSFRWPVRGRVIKDFGTVNGDRNDGINLAVPEGTSVKASEDGEVIYAGNELKGYGNLVLVKHAEGWVTAYAHASELLVNRGDKVARGQIIARAGATGGVNQPQLHFEIRKGQRPIDPKQFLASN